MMNKKTLINTQGWEAKSKFMKKKNAKLMHSGNIPHYKTLGIKQRQKTTTERGQFD